MSWDFYYCIFLKSLFQIPHFCISTAHDLKPLYVTSSTVTSQEWKLRIQIGKVLQFCLHCISAKYHTLRLRTFEGETFGSFDFLIGHQRVTWLVTIETLNPKVYCCLYQFQKYAFKGNKVTAPRSPKICEPFTPPRNLLAAQLEKIPSVARSD